MRKLNKKASDFIDISISITNAEIDNLEGTGEIGDTIERERDVNDNRKKKTCKSSRKKIIYTTTRCAITGDTCW